MLRWIWAQLACGILITTAVDAKPRRVVVGEISSSVRRDDVQEWLRTATLKEVDVLSTDASGKKQLVVSMALVRLGFAPTREGSRAECEVSAAVRERSKNQLVATLRGKVSLESESRSASWVEKEAVDAAVHNALVRVPSLLE